MGRVFPEIPDVLAKLEVANIFIPIAIWLFAMIYPIMVQISFEEIKRAVLSPKPIALALFAWFFLSVFFGRFLAVRQIQEYRTGLILL